MKANLTSRFLLMILSLIIFFSLKIFAQNKGTIVGQIVDELTGEPIIGANVLVENLSIGAATNLDGKFIIADLDLGSYTLRISHISYQSKTIKDVQVYPKRRTEIKITLVNQIIETSEVVVSGNMDKSYSNALLNLRKNYQNIFDGISAEEIKRTTDGLTSDILRRITGITIMENKFINIRGTSERYNLTQINNANVTSTESEKKSFSFDLISANLIENATVIKSYTPDLPANFGGGIVKLNLIDFPDDIKISVGYSTAFTTNSSLKSFYTYSNGTNFLGYDNGSRNLPPNFPSELNTTTFTREEINNFAKSFNNVWSPQNIKSPLNQNFSFAIGDGARLFGKNFGFVLAVNYKNDFKNSNLELYEYEANGEKRFEYSGYQSKISKNLGGLLNLSYQFSSNHKINLKNLHSHSSDDEVSLLNGFQYTDAGKEQNQTSLRYVERDLINSQIFGEHYLPDLLQSKLDWRIYSSISSMNEPDYRRVIYARDIGTDDQFAAVLGFQANLKNGGRFFSNLYDRGRGFAFNVKSNLFFGQIRFGGSFDINKRNFNSRLISVIINASGNGFTDFNLLYLPLDKIFSPENFRRNGFSIDEYKNGTNNYSAEEVIKSAYLMSEVPITLFEQRFNLIGGFRVEDATQSISTFDVSGKIPVSNSLKKTDILPSLNLIYKIGESTNLRLSYSQTLNRPELREIAPFAYFDFTTQTSIRGNPELDRSFIKNYDLRIENFPRLGQLISASLFYKNISNAIEKVVVTGSALGSERTYRNADNARVYGYELEFRYDFGFLLDYLSNLSFNLNYSRIYSEVNVKGSETTISREKRPLQGQSPYVINLSMVFDEPIIETSIFLSYNRIGERIIEVATDYVQDVVETPRDLIDLKVTKKLFNGFNIYFSIKDLLDRDHLLKQGDQISRKKKSNSTYSLGINYKLN